MTSLTSGILSHPKPYRSQATYSHYQAHWDTGSGLQNPQGSRETPVFDPNRGCWVAMRCFQKKGEPRLIVCR